MALLSPGLSCLPFLQLLYNQQVSLESSQAIVFELEPQLLPLGRAFLTISLSLWGVGLVKLTCYMCVLQWKPSFLLQERITLKKKKYRMTCVARIRSSTLHFGRFFGCRWIWTFLFGALTSAAMSPPFLQVMPACSEVLRLGMGAHGWVAWICQPWERSPSRSLLPIVEAAGCLRHPTSTLQGSC